MDQATEEITKAFTSLRIPKTHATVGLSNLIASHKDYKSLFVNRRLPEKGWSDIQIQHFLFILSTLDTNAKIPVSSKQQPDDDRWCGVGEREGRVYSSLVLNRHFGLSHGIGRSGDITEPQPKAVGSSVMAKLTLLLTMDAIRRGSGLLKDHAAKYGILLPLCTGMSMALTLSSLKTMKKNRSVVLWSRIDQKSCFKAIQSAGLECVLVPTKLNGDQVETDVETLQNLLILHRDSILAVITTTSCFAPRIPDKVDEVAKLCSKHDVFHLINNAYGLQSSQTSKLINRACVVGRVDAIVCSTDKNFLVPVGGAIVLSPSEIVVQTIGKIYAGRASASPLVDLFITLLSMGLSGYRDLLKKRCQQLASFPASLKMIAEKHGETLMQCPSNDISFGITLNCIVRKQKDDETEEDYMKATSSETSRLGAMLFSRCVSGTRVVPRGVSKTLGGLELQGFGSSFHQYPHSYMTAACAIGLEDSEIDEFLKRLDKTLNEFRKKAKK